MAQEGKEQLEIKMLLNLILGTQLPLPLLTEHKERVLRSFPIQTEAIQGCMYQIISNNYKATHFEKPEVTICINGNRKILLVVSHFVKNYIC